MRLWLDKGKQPTPMESTTKRHVSLFRIVRRSRTTELAAARPHLDFATCSARHLRAPAATTADAASALLAVLPRTRTISSYSKRRWRRATT